MYPSQATEDAREPDTYLWIMKGLLEETHLHVWPNLKAYTNLMFKKKNWGGGGS